MFLQSRTSQVPGAQMDPNSKMFMYILPVMFGFLSVSWPPSVLLYWITFSIAATIEQLMIMRSIRSFSEIEANPSIQAGKKEKKEK